MILVSTSTAMTCFLRKRAVSTLILFRIWLPSSVPRSTQHQRRAFSPKPGPRMMSTFQTSSSFRPIQNSSQQTLVNRQINGLDPYLPIIDIAGPDSFSKTQHWQVLGSVVDGLTLAMAGYKGVDAYSIRRCVPYLQMLYHLL
jgi:hypothetical protein